MNPFEFETLEALREELVSVIDHHLAHLSAIPRLDFGEPFYFMQSRVVGVPLGLEVKTLSAFRDGVSEVDASSIYYHMVEARTRLGHRDGDFAFWIRESLGLPDVADQLARVDTYLSSVERVRTRVVGLLDAAVEKAS